MFNTLLKRFLLGQTEGLANGYKTIVGALFLVGGIVVMNVPGLTLPGGSDMWADALVVVGASLAGLGVTHRAYKLGVDTPQADIELATTKGPTTVISDPLGADKK